MRTAVARDNYQPASRIAGLRRYAFIGDSMTFGAGVAPDESLPAAAERQINSLCADGPAEVVNFGVTGYNLWNSWLDFIDVPQVYDGVVVVLCSNDAEIFGRTYKISYPTDQGFPTWEKTQHGEAVAQCFDEIASFSKQHSLPVAFSFYRLVESPGGDRVSEIIHEQCGLHGFPFVDSLVPIKDRHFSRPDLVVSEANAHPSGMVHEAVGRYLVQTLHRQGWFGIQTETPIGTMAERILSSAQAMIELDDYAPDVAHHWALRALELKLHRARRLEALEAGSATTGSPSAILEKLTAISRCWHLGQRLQAFVGELSSLQHGVSDLLWSAQEERLRLEELDFALRSGLWDQLSVNLPALSSLPAPAQEKDQPLEPLDFFDECIGTLEHFGKALEKMRHQPAPTLTTKSPTGPQLQADLNTLSQLGDRLGHECQSMKETIEEMTKSAAEGSAALGAEQSQRVSRLAGAAIRKTQKTLEFIRRWPERIRQIGAPEYATYTTIEVTVRAPMMEEKTTRCFVFARAEYWTPIRLSTWDLGNFFADGTSTLIKLYVPIFYSGRIYFTPSRLHGAAVEIELVKVVVYNQAHRRRELAPESFFKDPDDRLISPPIYLS